MSFYVSFWHIAEVSRSAGHFRCWGVKLTSRVLGVTAAFDPDCVKTPSML